MCLEDREGFILNIIIDNEVIDDDVFLSVYYIFQVSYSHKLRSSSSIVVKTLCYICEAIV
jgi:hypothetical protein